MFRIQKLLLSDYEEIYEPVIVENPLTQVTESGEGIRQFHIALTATCLIFGCDEFNSVSSGQASVKSTADPEIESFRLVSLIPLHVVRIIFYKKSNREIMKITISEEQKSMYFEFGGHLYRNLFWNTWRERVATIRLRQPLYNHISGSSPFSSTDVLPEEEECVAEIHSVPRSTFELGGRLCACCE